MLINLYCFRKIKGKFKGIMTNFKSQNSNQEEKDFTLVEHEGLFDEYLEMGNLCINFLIFLFFLIILIIFKFYNLDF